MKNHYLGEFTKFIKTAGLNRLSCFTGFDVGESFSLRRVFCEGDRSGIESVHSGAEEEWVELSTLGSDEDNSDVCPSRFSRPLDFHKD